MSEWQGTKERTAQAFRQEPLWDLLGYSLGGNFVPICMRIQRFPMGRIRFWS